MEYKKSMRKKKSDRLRLHNELKERQNTLRETVQWNHKAMLERRLTNEIIKAHNKKGRKNLEYSIKTNKKKIRKTTRRRNN